MNSRGVDEDPRHGGDDDRGQGARAGPGQALADPVGRECEHDQEGGQDDEALHQAWLKYEDDEVSAGDERRLRRLVLDRFPPAVEPPHWKPK